ncbi:MAG: hypothetical protein JWN20_2346 [Jatrophihabitantaceae bacterium]|nr:hypothetical protein [Jatrophihabitantaceae bacterium]
MTAQQVVHEPLRLGVALGAMDAQLAQNRIADTTGARSSSSMSRSDSQDF